MPSGFSVLVVALIASQSHTFAETKTGGSGNTPVVINDVVDVGIGFAMRGVDTRDDLPNVHWSHTYKIRLPWPHWKIGQITLNLDLYNGFAESVTSLQRTRDATLSRDGAKLLLDISMGFTDMKFVYDFHAKCRLAEAHGTFTATMYSNSIRARASFLKGDRDCRLNLESLEVDHLDDLKIEATGLGPITKLLPWGTLQEDFNEAIKKKLVEYLQEMVEQARDFNLTCGNFIEPLRTRFGFHLGGRK